MRRGEGLLALLAGLLLAAPAQAKMIPGFAPWVCTDSARVYGLVPPTARPSYLSPTFLTQQASASSGATAGTTGKGALQSFVVRVGGDSATAVRTAAGTQISTLTWQQLAQHDYSLKGSPWSINEQWFYIENPTGTGCGGPYNGNALILDGQTYAPIKSNTVSGDSRWRSDPTKPWERLYGSGTSLKRVDIRDFSTVATYTLPFTVGGIGLSEGNESWDNRWVAMTTSGGGTVCIVDMIRNRVGAAVRLPLLTGGSADGDSADDVKISAWGGYMIASYDDTHSGARQVFQVDTANCVLYNNGATPPVASYYSLGNAGAGEQEASWVDHTHGFIHPLEHADQTYNPYTTELAECMVGVCQGANTDSGMIAVVRLRDGAVRHISIGAAGTGLRGEAYVGHCTAQNRLRPGWVVCDYECSAVDSDSSASFSNRMHDEVVGWRMLPDSSVAAFGKQCIRYGFKHTVANTDCGPVGCETAQGQAAVSPTGTRVVFHSNWKRGVPSSGFTANNWRRSYVIDARGVSPAGPRHIYVNPRSGDDRYSGEDSTHAWRSIAKANCAAGPSVVIHLLGGVYRGDPIRPAFGGFGWGADSSCRYVGDLPSLASASAAHGAKGGVVLKQYADSSVVCWPYVVISGVKADSSAAGKGGGVLSFRSVDTTYPTLSAVPLLNAAEKDSLLFSTWAALSFEGARSCIAYRDSITNRDSGAGNHGLISLRSSAGRNSDQNEIRRVKLTALLRENARLLADSSANFLTPSANVVDSCEFRVELTPSASPSTSSVGDVVKLSRAVGTRIANTRIVANPMNAVSTVSWSGLTLRDSSSYVSLYRDTLDFGIKVQKSASDTTIYPRLGITTKAVSSDWAANTVTVGLSADSCFFRVSDSFRNSNLLDHANLRSNVMLGSAQRAPLLLGPGSLNAVVLSANTLVGLGGHAVEVQAASIGASTFTNNIAYRNSSTAADSSVWRVLVPGSLVGWNFVENFNLLHSGTDSCRYAFKFGSGRASAPQTPCGSYCTGDPGADCWYAVAGKDGNSQWRTPYFKVVPSPARSDSLQFFYGTIFRQELAGGEDGRSEEPNPRRHGFGAVSAPQFTTPGVVTDLDAPQAWADSVSLTWTAVADDGASLTDPVLAYEVRYSTTEVSGALSDNEVVDDAWWVQATPFAGPTPLTPGATQSLTVTGLVADTRYWFAVRPINTGLVVGSYSNPRCAYASTTLACPQ